jgi:hypothetical protein
MRLRRTGSDIEATLPKDPQQVRRDAQHRIQRSPTTLSGEPFSLRSIESIICLNAR